MRAPGAPDDRGKKDPSDWSWLDGVPDPGCVPDELPALAAWAASGVALLALILPQTPAGEVQPSAALLAWAVAGTAALVLRGTARGAGPWSAWSKATASARWTAAAAPPTSPATTTS